MIQNTTSINVELNSYLLKVYNYIAAGLIVSGICAGLLYNIVLMQFEHNPVNAIRFLNLLNILCMIGTIGIIVYIRFQSLNNISVTKLNVLYWSFVSLIGFDYTTLLFVYTTESLFMVFFVSAAMFMLFSIYGYTTHSDLSGMNSFFAMSCIGILICILVNSFLIQSSSFQYMISVFGVIIFAALTAYDTQRIKSEYFYYSNHPSNDLMSKSAILGALSMYLNFINIFNFMLNLFGNRRD